METISVSLKMKLAITGSRKYTDYEELKQVVKSLAPNAEMIISGGAKGADQLAARYAKERGLEFEEIRPDYKKYFAKVAPLKRNSEIVAKADKVIAFYFQTQSGGTLDTAKKAMAAGKLLAEVINGKVARHENKLFLL